MSSDPRSCVSPFDAQGVLAKVRALEDAWNTRDLEYCVMINAIDCQWRHGTTFIWGREQIRAFIVERLGVTPESKAIIELWSWNGERVAIRFAVEFRDDDGGWHRGFGNENWECDQSGLIKRCLTSFNSNPIKDHERMLLWPAGPRPRDHPTLTEMAM